MPPKESIGHEMKQKTFRPKIGSPVCTVDENLLTNDVLGSHPKPSEANPGAQMVQQPRQL